MKTHAPTKMSRSVFLRGLALALPLMPATVRLARGRDDAGTNDVVVSPAEELKPDLGNLRALVELARSDIRAEKNCILAQNLPLSNAEAEGFWPLQREYDLEFNKLLDERYAAIIQFARQYGTMTDTQATALAQTSFDLETKRTELKKVYFAKFNKMIPALKAARFFQIENQLNMILDLKLAAALPLLK